MSKGPFFKFDWKEYIEYVSHLSKVEEVVIKNHFEELVKANSNMLEKSQPELDEAYNMFKEGWIMNGYYVY